MDIILENGEGKEIWVELKSIMHSRNIQTWKYTEARGGGAMGKEIIVDRVASVRAGDEDVALSQNFDEENIIKSVENRWLFQKFNVKRFNQRSHTKTEFGVNGQKKGTFLYKLSNVANDDVIYTSLKYDVPKKDVETYKKSVIQTVAKRDDLLAFLVTDAKDILFENIELPPLPDLPE